MDGEIVGDSGGHGMSHSYVADGNGNQGSHAMGGGGHAMGGGGHEVRGGHGTGKPKARRLPPHVGHSEGHEGGAGRGGRGAMR